MCFSGELLYISIYLPPSCCRSVSRTASGSWRTVMDRLELRSCRFATFCGFYFCSYIDVPLQNSVFHRMNGNQMWFWILLMRCLYLSCNDLMNPYLFRYTRVMRIDNSGGHCFEVGSIRVTNLLPDTNYRVRFRIPWGYYETFPFSWNIMILIDSDSRTPSIETNASRIYSPQFGSFWGICPQVRSHSQNTFHRNEKWVVVVMVLFCSMF